MSPRLHQRPAARAVALWLATALTASAVGVFGLPTLDQALHRMGAVDFADLLVAGCTLLALAGCLSLLVTTTAVLWDLRTGRAPAHAGALRRWVLAACGVAVLTVAAAPTAARATPAGHHDQSSVAGLPLPDRAVGGGPARSRAAGDRVVRVRPGDSLWSIAEHRIGVGASNTEIATYWQRLYTRNADTIGADPDRILPGQVLHLPSELPSER